MELTSVFVSGLLVWLAAETPGKRRRLKLVGRAFRSLCGLVWEALPRELLLYGLLLAMVSSDAAASPVDAVDRGRSVISAVDLESKVCTEHTDDGRKFCGKMAVNYLQGLSVSGTFTVMDWVYYSVEGLGVECFNWEVGASVQILNCGDYGHKMMEECGPKVGFNCSGSAPVQPATHPTPSATSPSTTTSSTSTPGPSSSSPLPTELPKDKVVFTPWLIGGISGGGILLLAILAALGYYLYRRYQNRGRRLGGAGGQGNTAYYNRRGSQGDGGSVYIPLLNRSPGSQGSPAAASAAASQTSPSAGRRLSVPLPASTSTGLYTPPKASSHRSSRASSSATGLMTDLPFAENFLPTQCNCSGSPSCPHFPMPAKLTKLPKAPKRM